MDDFVSRLTTSAAALGIQVTPAQAEAFAIYYRFLTEWNHRVNLTAITEPGEVIVKHFVDSLSCQLAADWPLGSAVIDIGTGAGFPGIPLKIVRPEIRLTLLDSLNKRIQFLYALVQALGLTKVTVLHGRAEEYGQKSGFREQYDVVVSRAVARLNILAEFCLPFAKVGGMFLAMKGPDADEELAEAAEAITILGGTVTGVTRFSMPETGDNRSIVTIAKVFSTPAKYPRRPGMPEKKPL